MATTREKQLAIQILKERIERATGKKVVLTEAPYYAPNDLDRDRKRVEDIITKANGDLGKVRSLATQMRNASGAGKVGARANEAIQGLMREVRGNFKAEAYLAIYRIFLGL